MVSRPRRVHLSSLLPLYSLTNYDCFPLYVNTLCTPFTSHPPMECKPLISPLSILSCLTNAQPLKCRLKENEREKKKKPHNHLPRPSGLSPVGAAGVVKQDRRIDRGERGNSWWAQRGDGRLSQDSEVWEQVPTIPNGLFLPWILA